MARCLCFDMNNVRLHHGHAFGLGRGQITVSRCCRKTRADLWVSVRRPPSPLMPVAGRAVRDVIP